MQSAREDSPPRHGAVRRWVPAPSASGLGAFGQVTTVGRRGSGARLATCAVDLHSCLILSGSQFPVCSEPCDVRCKLV